MFKRLIASLVCFTFIFSNLQNVHAQDFSVNQLPVPGTMIGISAPFAPLALKGLIVNPQKPLDFQFIIDTGKGPQDTASIKEEANQLVKYFLAGLTIPEGDLWVNLSPYEKNRMVPEALGQTDLGRDLLAQDYILKQLTASLIYPGKDLGKEFWSKVYAKAQQQFGTTNIPVNTFNKVWILPDQAQTYENGNAAYVTKSTLKVMLDEDYTALQKHMPVHNGTDSIGSQIVRQIILPEIEKEINAGKNFAPLRQIYQALILAQWYKETIRNGLLDAIYTDKNKVAGVNLSDSAVKEQIYNRYLQAYKKGTFNYIKEDPTPDGQVVPRKYFSGGTFLGKIRRTKGNPSDIEGHDGAMLSIEVGLSKEVYGSQEDQAMLQTPNEDAAMSIDYKGGFEERPFNKIISPETFVDLANKEEIFAWLNEKSFLDSQNRLQVLYIKVKKALVGSKFEGSSKEILAALAKVTSGKSSPIGDGKDIEMRKVANASIVELFNDEPSSSKTTEGLELPKGTPGEVVMLARNSDLKGAALRPVTIEAINQAYKNGAKFVVGDMPDVDSQFIEYLMKIGATATIYHTGDTPRIDVTEETRYLDKVLNRLPNESIVLFGGATASGKSTKSEDYEKHPGENIHVIRLSVDEYPVEGYNKKWNGVDETDNNTVDDIDHPDADDFSRLGLDVAKLLKNEPVTITPPKRMKLPTRVVQLKPGMKNIIIIDGIHALLESCVVQFPKEIKDKIKLKVYFDLDQDIRSLMRLLRDYETKIKPRTDYSPDKHRSKMLERLRFLYNSIERGKKYVIPTRKEAGFLVLPDPINRLRSVNNPDNSRILEEFRESINVSSDPKEVKRLNDMLDNIEDAAMLPADLELAFKLRDITPALERLRQLVAGNTKRYATEEMRDFLLGMLGKIKSVNQALYESLRMAPIDMLRDIDYDPSIHYVTIEDIMPIWKILQEQGDATLFSDQVIKEYTAQGKGKIERQLFNPYEKALEELLIPQETKRKATKYFVARMKQSFQGISVPTETIEKVMETLENESILPSAGFGLYYNDTVHGFEHSVEITKKVFEWANSYNLSVDTEALAVAAFLHDINGLGSFGNKTRINHHIEGGTTAGMIISKFNDQNWSEARINLVKSIIGSHRGVPQDYKAENYPAGYVSEKGLNMPMPISIEEKLLRDADTYIELTDFERLMQTSLDYRNHHRLSNKYYDPVKYGIGDEQIQRRLEVILNYQRVYKAADTDLLEFLLGKLLVNCDPNYFELSEIQDLVRKEASTFFRKFLILTIQQLKSQPQELSEAILVIERVVNALGDVNVQGDISKWQSLSALHKEALNTALNELRKSGDLAMSTPIKDHAALVTTPAENGGIDLNQINVLRNGKTINVQFDPAQLNALEQGGFKGFSFKIESMTRISSPFQLLGINAPTKQIMLVKA